MRDVASIAIELGGRDDDITRDAAGPESYVYRDFIKLIARSMGVRRLLVPMPAIVAWLSGRVMGLFLRDMVITRGEIRGLMQGLVASEEEPLGEISFSEWVADKGPELGRHYHNDLEEREYRT